MSGTFPWRNGYGDENDSCYHPAAPLEWNRMSIGRRVQNESNERAVLEEGATAANVAARSITSLLAKMDPPRLQALFADPHRAAGGCA